MDSTQEINHSERSHALLSPSSAYRWLNCTPSVRFALYGAEGQKEERSAAAEEGTLAHEVVQFVAENALSEYNGWDIDDEEECQEFLDNISLLMPEGADEEMIQHALGYTRYIRDNILIPGTGPWTWRIEEQLDLRAYIPEGFGTADFFAVSDDELHFLDYKYGIGHKVEVEENTQLLIYAVGAYQWIKDNQPDRDIKTIVLHIYQPRLKNIKSWSITAERLNYWADHYLKPAALKAYEGAGDFLAGSHCDYCPAMIKCKTYLDMILSAEALAGFDANTLKPEELGNSISRVERLSGWLTKAKERASELIASGTQVAGYKLVRGRSSRKFSDEALVGGLLMESGYDTESIWQTSLISVAVAEKLLGKKKFTALLGRYVETTEGKPTLATEDDKRPSIHQEIDFD